MSSNSTIHIAPLDAAAAEPFYRQIYERIRGAIGSGLLKPGDRIPSARALSQELGLARGTIDTAYGLLSAEGYIEARGQAGTVVASGVKIVRPFVKSEVIRPRHAEAPSFRPDSILPFQMGLPALDAFPRKIWARIGARRIRAMQTADMVHPSIFGYHALRAEIASYLQVSRGIECGPSQVFITSGYRQTLELVSRALLISGDRVWVEDPGYPPTRALLSSAQLIPVPVPVDDDGMMVDFAIHELGEARAAVVTPAHQSPLCVSLSLPRRLALLDWAVRKNAWIIEDDYDGEYRYVSRPLPALKSLDRDGRVLYAGTFSKVLFPAIRLAYLVVPEGQVARFDKVSQLLAGGSPQLTQAIVTDFITDGHFARHIQRMRSLYAERRDITKAALEHALAGRVRIDSPPGGMHLILRLDGGGDRSLALKLLQAGLYAEALSDWSIARRGESALLLNFTNIESRPAADKLVRRLAKVLQDGKHGL